MRILLLRHGQSRDNVERRIQGHDDPLTDLGRQQAGLLGQQLAENYSINRLLSSGMHRANETATIIAEYTGHEFDSDPRFSEIMNGDATGKLWTDWREANPELSDVWGWDVRHADAAWPGGESGRDVLNRAWAALTDLIEQYKDTDDTVAVVSHGGAIAWLASRINGDDLEYWPAKYHDIANCSITEIDISTSGEPEITAWNLIDHLGDTFFPHEAPIATRT